MSGDHQNLDARSWLENEGFDLAVLNSNIAAVNHDAKRAIPCDLSSYDRIVVAFSGGADSLALLLHLLELGVPVEMIEAHHHLVDGREGSNLMDWPVTEAYCEAVCAALGISLTYSWRQGGFEREMTRTDSATAPVLIPDGNGGYRALGGDGPLGTRNKFPQVSMSLQTRWCSSALKIDCFARYLCNDPKFLNSRTLVLTGERAEESAARAKYKCFEPHRCDTRNSRRVPRHIDHWRAVHTWSKAAVWRIIERFKIVGHPAYQLGSWGRCSCAGCIYGSRDQWATLKVVLPDQFGRIANYERQFKITIHRKESVEQRASQGTVYPVDPMWVAIANSKTFDHPVFDDNWKLPPGAFGESCGPT